MKPIFNQNSKIVVEEVPAPTCGDNEVSVSNVYHEAALSTVIQEEPWFKNEWVCANDIRKELAKYVVPFNNDLFAATMGGQLV